jgi:hypothetical protein
MSTINILERFGIMDASDLRLFNKENNKILLKIVQSNELVLDVKADSVSAKEKGAEVLDFQKAKTGTLSLKTETITFAQLAEALGVSAGLVLNSGTESYDRSEEFTVTEAGTIECTLEHTPAEGIAVSINALTRDKELKKELTATKVGNVYTITDADLAINDIVEINYVEKLEAGKVYTFKVGSQTASATRRLVADVLYKNRTDGSIGVAQLEIPSVSADQSMSITFSADKPSEFNLKFKCLADANKVDEDGNPLFFTFKTLV